MAFSATSVKWVSIVAALLGALQGIVWFLGSVFSIFIYYDELTLLAENDTVVSFTVELIAGGYDRPIVIFYFVYAVLSLSLGWFSTLILTAYSAKTHQTMRKIFSCWSVNSLLVSLTDVVLTSFLGRDLSDLLYEFDPPDNLTTAYTIFIIIAIRGVIFWMLNVIFAGYLFVFAVQESPKEIISQEPVNVFTTKTPETNETFVDSEERLANIRKPGQRGVSTFLSSNIPPPVAPSLLTEKHDSYVSIIDPIPEDAFNGIDRVPTPDYTPLSSPVLSKK